MPGDETMMGRNILSPFGATSRRAAVAGHRISSRASIATLLTSVLVLATSSCGGAGSSIVGSTTQDVQSFQAAAGENQAGTAGSVLPTPLTVRALTRGGKGVSSISVQWTFSGGGGSLTPDGTVSQSLTTVTDKQGESSIYWQLDTIAGDQTATATLSGTSSNSTTTVKFHSHGKAGGPATLVVSPTVDTLAVGDSIQFTATVLDRWKNVISGATVSWSSSNDSVVTVSSTGMATALRSGSATVLATTSATSTTSPSVSAAGSTSISGGASVNVESSTASVTNPPATVTDLKVGSATDTSVTLQWTQVNDGTGSPANYALRYATPTITWASASATEASVNGTSIGATESYTFKGLQAGTSYQFQLVSYRGTLNVNAVFGSLSNIVSGLTTGTGTPQTPSVTVTPASLSFTSINATAQLSAVAKDSTGNTVTNPGFTWKSLATSIATVSTTGLVTAKAVGATVIIVTAACCGSDTASVTVANDTTATSPSAEPSYNPATDKLMVLDSMNEYTTATAMGATNTGHPQIVPLPSPVGNGKPVDTTKIQVITGLGGSGKALRIHYTGAYQDNPTLWLMNSPQSPGNVTNYFQYWARIQSSVANNQVAIKWFEAWHAVNTGYRIQWNTHAPAPDDPVKSIYGYNTVWQICEGGCDSDPNNTDFGDQPFGPYPTGNLADGQWHRYTFAYKPNSSSGANDAFARMWVDGKLITDCSSSTVGVTPAGGLKPWCTQVVFDQFFVNDGIRSVMWGSNQTTTSAAWNYDIDNFIWWTGE